MRLRTAMNETLTVRLSVAEKQRMKERARSRGMTVSDFIRETVTQAMGRVA